MMTVPAFADIAATRGSEHVILELDRDGYVP